MDFKYKRIAKTIKYEDNVHSTKCHIINIHYIRREDMARSHIVMSVLVERAVMINISAMKTALYKLTYEIIALPLIYAFQKTHNL